VKKTFPCGHTGKGKFCHRCAAEEAKRLSRKAEKVELREKLDASGVDLAGLPSHVALKAISIITGMRHGRDYNSFGGKRFGPRRGIISNPVGYSYRMLCQDTGSEIKPVEVLSHAQYNRRFREALRNGL
jgi:hypothetical protein